MKLTKAALIIALASVGTMAPPSLKLHFTGQSTEQLLSIRQKAGTLPFPLTTESQVVAFGAWKGLKI